MPLKIKQMCTLWTQYCKLLFILHTELFQLPGKAVTDEGNEQLQDSALCFLAN